MKLYKLLAPAVVILTVAETALAAEPREVQKGYRGFVEWTTDITGYKIDYDNRATAWSTGLTLVNGYQFNPRLYLGLGIGVQPSVNSSGGEMIPLFVDVRSDQRWGRFTPYGDLRVGYNLCDGGGLYLSPSVGYRFNWGRRVNLNVGVGLTLRGSSTENYTVHVTQLPDGNVIANTTYDGKTHHIKPMFALRLGLDF